MKIRLPEKKVASLVAAFIRLLALTIRVRIDDANGFLTGKPRGPFIIAVWHNRILGLVIAGLERPKVVPMTVLTSTSRDGAMLSEVMVRLGLRAVRGSSSRKGAVALLQLLKEYREERTLLVTPDGPRGPCYQLSPGVITLAQKTGAPVLAVHVDFARSKRLKSWDRFFVPLPFSQVQVRVDPARFFPKTESEETFEAQRLELETTLRAGAGE